MMVKIHPWTAYSRKLAARIDKPHCVGRFFTADSVMGTRCVIGRERDETSGVAIAISLLVDENDGTIIDAVFQAYGSSALIGAAEGACRLAIGSTYARTAKMTSELIDRHFREGMTPSFPEEAQGSLDAVIIAIKKACEQCDDITLPEDHSAPAVDMNEIITGEGYPGWIELGKVRKIEIIEEALNDSIRPYIELDGGGVDVIDLVDDLEVVIQYRGACEGCLHAGGATLSYIQQALRAKVCKDIIVVPQL